MIMVKPMAISGLHSNDHPNEKWHGHCHSARRCKQNDWIREFSQRFLSMRDICYDLRPLASSIGDCKFEREESAVIPLLE
jgi:hypothetical protein